MDEAGPAQLPTNTTISELAGHHGNFSTLTCAQGTMN